ncbi:SDR family NAD(P)-dependent oxidoreductase [Fulvivirga maritima]|uniref:SDR family NAD(P)-dependent oxidoreductase n=1 Tax=Fulvivirga maritima TaxID=2904247 RepID=UPI001F341281|nr:SDR family NAD(P)-dependent oxidoreductase [Fulvivirga maritima]UII28939.1 SDR family NAD(P)-dependent oxidoreductase [Fulvivirga maritima]
MTEPKVVLILGANSDVAKEALKIYIQEKNYTVIAASRNTDQLREYVATNDLPTEKVKILKFDATDFDSHKQFYDNLPAKPHIVVYAAGYLKDNEEALRDFDGAFQMMKVHYAGAVSILNIICMDETNNRLEQIIGLSSLSGVRGRKSNFIYGSTKAAFTQYFAGMRQYLFPRKIKVNVIVAGYIRSKMTEGLDLTESLMLEPEFIARAVVKANKRFIIVPGYKWKAIYHILRMLPEQLVARLP